MKKEHIPYVLMCVLAVALAVLTFRVKDLENELVRTRNNLNTEIYLTRQDVSSIYRNVDERMKKDASLFSMVDYTLGDLQSNHTVPVAITLLPKTLSEEMELTVSFNGEVTAFERTGDEFKGIINANIFIEDYTYPLVTIITSEKQTEYLDTVNLSGLYLKYLPEFSAEMAGGSTYNHKAKALSVSHSFTVSEHTQPNGVKFEKFTLIEEINGKEIHRNDIRLQNGVYSESYKKTFNVKIGDWLKIYVEAEDSLGYIHKRVAYAWYENDSGAVADVAYHGEAILDKDGNILVNNEFVRI